MPGEKDISWVVKHGETQPQQSSASLCKDKYVAQRIDLLLNFSSLKCLTYVGEDHRYRDGSGDLVQLLYVIVWKSAVLRG